MRMRGGGGGGALRGTWRVAAGLLLLWVLILLYMSASLYQSGDLSERTERQLQKAMQELDSLKLQNTQLQNLAAELRDIQNAAGGVDRETEYERLRLRLSETERRLESALAGIHDVGKRDQILAADMSHAPSSGFEMSRRRTVNDVREQWMFVRHELRAAADRARRAGDGTSAAAEQLDSLLEDTGEMYRTIMADLYNLSLSDGAEEWRRKEAAELSDLVQRRLHYLQNPADCSKAKKLVCNLGKACGYGCQIHHVVYCFMIAYGTERMLHLQSAGWSYGRGQRWKDGETGKSTYSSGGWNKVFKPVNEKCPKLDGLKQPWSSIGVIKNTQVVELPIVDSLHPRPPFMPLGIPEDLAPRLLRLHGNPSVWWISQFVLYLLRPQPELQKQIEEAEKKLGFATPIVGVHVRRTDKVGTEAAFHGIDEYMYHVNEWYALYESIHATPVKPRRVYLATDEPNLLDEAKKKYPEYEFISDNAISRTASMGTRYSDTSLRGIILDIYFLSRSNHLVCTFSSQVCRLAYEMMQTLHADASDRFTSLDDIFYFGGQNAHRQRAVLPHAPRRRDHIELKIGDIIGVAGNHWDGYSKGQNARTKRSGLYPSYKVEEIIDIVSYPTYPQVPLKKES